jgi:hypothetical protein
MYRLSDTATPLGTDPSGPLATLPGSAAYAALPPRTVVRIHSRPAGAGGS